MEITGSLKLIRDTQAITDKFSKREMVVTTDEQYPQDIMIEFVNDKCDLLDKFKVNQGVTVGINIRGREWVNPQGESKYFNSIQGWKIDPKGKSSSAPAPAPAAPIVDEDEDDLPF